MTGAALGIVWGLVRGNAAGWDSAEVIASIAAGVLLVAAFVAWEARARAPMLPLSLFRSRGFSAGNAAIFFTFASLFSLRSSSTRSCCRSGSATARSTPGCG